MIFALVPALLILCYVSPSHQQQPKFIYGGNATNITQFPFHAVVLTFTEIYKMNLCGGSITHLLVILTAAQCIGHKKPRSIQVRYGIDDYRQEGIVDNVVKYYCHEDFMRIRYEHDDICLLRTSKKIHFDAKVGPLMLPVKWESKEQIIREYGPFYLTGFGLWNLQQSQPYPQQFSFKLRAAQLTIHSLDQCNYMLNTHEKLDYTSTRYVCAGTENPYSDKKFSEGACGIEDNGGALVGKKGKTFYALGVAIRTFCHHVKPLDEENIIYLFSDNKNTIFVNTSHHYTWITNALSNYLR